MKNKTIYSSKSIELLNKRRAEELTNHIPGKVILHEGENVWAFSTLIKIDEDDSVMVNVLFFEEVVAFEIFAVLPEHLNNDLFKRKVANQLGDSEPEFLVLEKYNARYFLAELKSSLALMVNIAYPYSGDDKADVYNINTVADILHYIGTDLVQQYKEYLDTQKM